jgi:RNA polymerase sigma-70 factor (ECF subfamily)
MSDGVSVIRLPAPAGTVMHETSLPDTDRGPDAESQQWLDALSAAGPKHQDALDRLHAMLLRAARFEIKRRRRGLAGSQPGELEDLATQAAGDALMAIMRKLHTFRGDSQFTTWAYKFALLEAAVKVRRRTWQEREVSLEDDGWAQLADRRTIAEALTPHQRAVLIAITLNDVPIDVLAERLSTTRGALYKTLHDGRKKLRARLAKDGHTLDYLQEGRTP